MNRIYGRMERGVGIRELRVRPLQRSNRSHIPAGVERKDQHFTFWTDTHENLAVDGIDGQLVEVRNLDVRPHDHADGSLVSVRSSAEKLDRLGVRLRHHNL